MLDRVRQQVGRLEITADDLAGRNRCSALFKTMFLAFHAKGAKDWDSNLTIGLNRSGARHRIQFHHIFPKAYLKGTYRPAEVDDIANLSFIDGVTNLKIRTTPPSEYLAKLIDDRGEDIRAQSIPTDKTLRGLDRYPDFLAARRELIPAELNAFINKG